MLVDTDRTLVASRPTIDRFLRSFDAYLVENELRCPPPTIDASEHSHYFDCLDLFPNDDLFFDPNQRRTYIPDEDCTYWLFNRSFPLADACQIWRILETEIDSTLIERWRRIRKKTPTELNLKRLAETERHLCRQLQAARASRNTLRVAAYCMIFAGFGKPSKTKLKRI